MCQHFAYTTANSANNRKNIYTTVFKLQLKLQTEITLSHTLIILIYVPPSMLGWKVFKPARIKGFIKQP